MEMEIERILKITDSNLRNGLWDFYHRLFSELNASTPLSQTLDRPRFRSWLESTRAVKLVVREAGVIHAFAIVSGDLRHDPLISIPYWKRVQPGRKVYHFPVIAISESFRETNPGLCFELMQAMMREIPNNAVALFFHSTQANPAMPRLIKLACRGRVQVETVDTMACVLCDWATPTGS